MTQQEIREHVESVIAAHRGTQVVRWLMMEAGVHLKNDCEPGAFQQISDGECRVVGGLWYFKTTAAYEKAKPLLEQLGAITNEV